MNEYGTHFQADGGGGSCFPAPAVLEPVSKPDAKVSGIRTQR